jgi:hypothetical protein
MSPLSGRCRQRRLGSRIARTAWAAWLVVLLVLSTCTLSRSVSATAPSPRSAPSSPAATLSPAASPSAPAITWKPKVALSFTSDDGVSRADRSFIRSALRQAVRLFPYPHSVDARKPTVAVFIHSTNGEMTRPNEIAEVRTQSIHVFVGTKGWRDATAIQRRQAMFHEWVHVLQQLEASAIAGPVWLTEGTAEWAAWDAMARLGFVERRDIRAFEVQAARSIDPDRKLRRLEGQAFYERDREGRNYALAYLAVDLLHPRRGWRTIIRFYASFQDGWEKAFADAFGVSLTRFYRKFERSRAAGFPAA